MRNKEELLSSQIQLVNEIYTHAREMGLSNDDIEPITDGVHSIDGYLNSPTKIMWILKEPVDDVINGKPAGGGWSITDHCFGVKDNVWSQPTWQPIIYITYGYLHGLMWKDMNWIRDDKDMANVLENIAYLNVSKMPGYSKSDWKKINEGYSIWKTILEKQIKLYEPQVIIFGGTFSHFKNDYEARGLKSIDTVQGVIDVYKIDDKILIDAYHPLQTQFDRGTYVDSIILMLKKYLPI